VIVQEQTMRNRGKFPGDCLALGRGGADKFGEVRDFGARQAQARP
jgi:hypothetical protein